MGCTCEQCVDNRNRNRDIDRINAELDQWNNGKRFVKNGIVAEIRWIQEGIDKGFDLDPKTILVYLANKAEELGRKLN
jgi:hypothetical protein